jgi:anti-sigma28 factor (negative regulator of flagellin synthesis)
VEKETTMVATNDRINRITTARRDRITRSSRVRLLQKQIQSGEYQVDVDRLAECLIERAEFHRHVKADLLADTPARTEA